jgi:hypothetical protein
VRDPRFAYGGVALIVLLVIAWGPTPGTRHFLPMLFMTILLIVGTEVLRRQIAREHPEASREATTRRIWEWASSVPGRGGSARSSNGDRITQLERLGKLRDGGVIDAAQFDRERARILGETPAATA